MHVARGILGLFNSFALVSYRSAVTAAYGEGAGMWYLIFQASQFHIIYYASRTLPNMFAFGIGMYAMPPLFDDSMSHALQLPSR